MKNVPLARSLWKTGKVDDFIPLDRVEPVAVRKTLEDAGPDKIVSSFDELWHLNEYTLEDKLTLALLWLNRFRDKKDAPFCAWKTMDFDNLNALEDKDLIFEYSRRRRMTSPIVFTKHGEAEAKRLLEIFSKALDETIR